MSYLRKRMKELHIPFESMTFRQIIEWIFDHPTERRLTFLDGWLWYLQVQQPHLSTNYWEYNDQQLIDLRIIVRHERDLCKR